MCARCCWSPPEAPGATEPGENRIKAGEKRPDDRHHFNRKTETRNKPQKNTMPKYVIEREIPGAGKLNTEELRGISQKSCGVLRKLGSEIQWIQSYVTDDKLYCVYIAPNEEMVREHARLGGFPANRVSEVRRIIDPTTAE
jgi:hypothetical protein